jgi:hypothetical protein
MPASPAQRKTQSRFKDLRVYYCGWIDVGAPEVCTAGATGTGKGCACCGSGGCGLACCRGCAAAF